MSAAAYIPLIEAEAERQGVPPELAVAMARRESGFNSNARGKDGEIGLFQLKPGTAREVGVNPYDVLGNIQGGIAYLRKQFDRFGSWDLALQAYNGGAGNVERGTVSSAARAYSAALAPYAGSWAPSLPSFADLIPDLPDVTVPALWSPGSAELSQGAKLAMGLALAALAFLVIREF